MTEHALPSAAAAFCSSWCAGAGNDAANGWIRQKPSERQLQYGESTAFGEVAQPLDDGEVGSARY